MIPIRNVYYMLSYAFQSLKSTGIVDVDLEDFDNADKLYAEILIRCVKSQLRRGLGRNYKSKEEITSSIKGKINVSESIKTQSINRRQLACLFDEFSPNTRLNQIVKSTLMLLLYSDISIVQKREIRKLLVFFSEVDNIEVTRIDWSFSYNRNNQEYQLIIGICRIVIDKQLQTQKSGYSKLPEYMDEQKMSHLYEKFILEYYRKHYPELNPSASYIDWQLDSEDDGMLPTMKSDITLQKDNKVLIIDAKYYSHTTQLQYDKHTYHSSNLYQIFTYVKNKDQGFDSINHTVSGMLLYAKTDEEIIPDSTYSMSGNKISVKTLDLNQEFTSIAARLDSIAETELYNITRQ